MVFVFMCIYHYSVKPYIVITTFRTHPQSFTCGSTVTGKVLVSRGILVRFVNGVGCPTKYQLTIPSQCV